MSSKFAERWLPCRTTKTQITLSLCTNIVVGWGGGTSKINLGFTFELFCVGKHILVSVGTFYSVCVSMLCMHLIKGKIKTYLCCIKQVWEVVSLCEKI